MGFNINRHALWSVNNAFLFVKSEDCMTALNRVAEIDLHLEYLRLLVLPSLSLMSAQQWLMNTRSNTYKGADFGSLFT